MDFNGVELASNNKRAVAFFIDELLLSVLIIIVYYDSIATVSSPEEVVMVTSAMALPYTIIKFIYHTYFINKYGATLGKLAMKIRVVDYYNNIPNLSSSLSRSGIRVFSEAVFYLGFLWAYFNPQRQTWHDKFAKTLVVKVV
ncbi:MAG: RDD family protein [Campylobacteraceae bacterium]|nr:RDD family protein [Campylobacteraceae bacterium]